MSKVSPVNKSSKLKGTASFIQAESVCFENISRSLVENSCYLSVCQGSCILQLWTSKKSAVQISSGHRVTVIFHKINVCDILGFGLWKWFETDTFLANLSQQEVLVIWSAGLFVIFFSDVTVSCVTRISVTPWTDCGNNIDFSRKYLFVFQLLTLN